MCTIVFCSQRFSCFCVFLVLIELRSSSFVDRSISPASFSAKQVQSIIIMVVRLRLARWGRTHSPFYRMVAANCKAPRDGKFLEIVGTYNPLANPKTGVKEIRLKTDRLKYWLSVGAQPSDRVAWILGKFGILPPPPRRYNPQKAVPRKDRPKRKRGNKK